MKIHIRWPTVLILSEIKLVQFVISFYHHWNDFYAHVGALVAVNCHINLNKGKSIWIKGVTDEYGDFTIDLPSHLHAIPNLDRKCSVKILRIPKNSLCKPAYVRRHKELRLSSVGNGIRTYDAGTVRFQHLTSTTKQGCVRKEKENSKMLL